MLIENKRQGSVCVCVEWRWGEEGTCVLEKSGGDKKQIFYRELAPRTNPAKYFHREKRKPRF